MFETFFTSLSPFAKRLVIGKTLGFAIGLLGFLILPLISEATLMFRFGILFWYTTFGVFIAFSGVLDKHPVLPMKMPFWFRGLFFGAWLNLLIVLLAFPTIATLFTQMRLIGLPALSPFCLIIEGALIGVLIDYIATRYAGEGESLFVSKQKTKKKMFGIF